jgi:hypothetical protein
MALEERPRVETLLEYVATASLGPIEDAVVCVYELGRFGSNLVLDVIGGIIQAADAHQAAQLLSDHPDHEHRVTALTQHFRENPTEFARFSSDAGTARTSVVLKNSALAFLQ